MTMDFITTHPSTPAEAKAFLTPTSLNDFDGCAEVSDYLTPHDDCNGQAQEQRDPSGSNTKPATTGSLAVDMTPGITAGHGVVLKLQNLVVTANLGCRLDLTTIARYARNTEYKPKRFPACIMRIREPKSTAFFFASGKIVVTGTKAQEDARLATRKFIRVIQKLGYQATFKDYTISNMIASCDVGFQVRLEGLADRHDRFSNYEPELFPGLVYRMMMPRITLLIFVSGKVVLTGAKTKEDLYEAFNLMFPVLVEFRKIKAV